MRFSARRRQPCQCWGGPDTDFGIGRLGPLAGDDESRISFVVKFNHDGTVAWQHALSPIASDDVGEVEVTANNSIVLSQVTDQSSLTLGTHSLTFASKPSAYLAKLSSDGSSQWLHSKATLGLDSTLGSAAFIALASVPDSDSELIFFDQFTQLVDDPEVSPDSRFARIGRLNSQLATAAPGWTQDFPGIIWPSSESRMVVDALGNTLVASTFYSHLKVADVTLQNDDTNVYVMKLAPDGRPRWLYHLNVASRSELRGLDTDSTGHTWIAFSGIPDGVVSTDRNIYARHLSLAP